MEVIYNSDRIGANDYHAYLEDGFDAGPLLYREDPDAPGFYELWHNPLWEIESQQIIKLSDYTSWYESIDYKSTLNWLFRKGELGIGKRTGFFWNNATFSATNVKYHKTYLTRIDMDTFSEDVIIIAEIAAYAFGHYETTKEWYRFRTIRSVKSDLSGETEITVYRPEDAIKGWAMADSLVPIIPYSRLEDAAREMLETFYDEALRMPCKVDAYEYADRMGYTVQKAFLSEDRHIRGKVIFDEMEITIFDPETGRKTLQTIKDKTILIDPAANKGTSRDFTEDTIMHECVHIYWHQPFQKLQMIHRERLEDAGLNCDLETLLQKNADNDDLNQAEKQARKLAPRNRMPAVQTAILAQQYQQENDRHYYNHGRAVEKTISQVAAFLGTSKEITRNRLKELGNNDVNGVLVYCNDGYLPRHSWSTQLQNGESYSVESNLFYDLMKRDPILNALMKYEVFVYVDGFVCINDPLYITVGKSGRHLKSYALKDVSRCCLKFSIHRDHDETEYTYGAFNSIDKRGMSHITFDVSSVASILNEANVVKGIRKNLPDEFLETLEGYIRALNISKNQLAEITTLDEDRLNNIRRNKVKNISLDEVVVIGVGLGLQPEEIDDLVDKSPTKYDRSDRTIIIRILIRKLYKYPVTTFNEAMVACGQKPLTYI